MPTDPNKKMIAVDWGTSSLRAFLFQDGTIVARRDGLWGITRVRDGAFEQVLRGLIGDWVAEGGQRVLMAGMIGSRQGWVEAPYLPCPAGPDELAARLTPVAFAGADVAIVSGLRHQDATGVPEVMRGEEVQLLGALATGSSETLVCLPGTHSKWATLADGRITGFTTHMTGEAFAVFREHTILGRMMREGPTDDAAFGRGVDRAGEAGGLLHHLFGVRALGLFGALPEDGAGSYLSGLLIGHEIAAVAPVGRVLLIGEAPLCRLYQLALERRGVASTVAAPDLAASGLALIAERATWH